MTGTSPAAHRPDGEPVLPDLGPVGRAGALGSSVTSAAVRTQLHTCYRHGGRRAGVICQRCDRPICPSCMHSASVGFHCPECIKSGVQTVIHAGRLGGRRSAPPF